MGRKVTVDITCDFCLQVRDANEMAFVDSPLTYEASDYIVDCCKPCWDDKVSRVIDDIVNNSRQPEKISTFKKKRTAITPTGDYKCDVGDCTRSFQKEHGLNMHKAIAHKVE